MGEVERAAKIFQDARCNGAGIHRELTDALSDPSPLVRHVAAIELAQRWPDELPERIIREMLDTLGRDEYFDPPPFESDYAEATATDKDCGCLGQDIVVAFSYLACNQAEFVIPRLLEFWSFDSQFYELAHALLALAFPRSTSRIPSKNHLTGVQRRILTALIAQPTIWGRDMTWKEHIARYGLPDTLSELRKFMGYRDES